mgnify:CR=1 FL=1
MPTPTSTKQHEQFYGLLGPFSSVRKAHRIRARLIRSVARWRDQESAIAVIRWAESIAYTEIWITFGHSEDGQPTAIRRLLHSRRSGQFARVFDELKDKAEFLHRSIKTREVPAETVCNPE